MTASNSNIIIDVNNLTVSYHKKPAIKGISLKIQKSSVVGIIGPNGAGKSTLIKGILGLLPVDSGSVKLFGNPNKQMLKRTAYIPQKEQFDWDFPISVYDVVMMGRYVHLGIFQSPKENDRQIADESLTRLEMIKYKNTQIRNLSGGQQQRVFLARALAQQAELYLMDEPFVGVDAKTETAIFALIKELKASGKTILIVHHDLSKVNHYFDELIMINQRLVAFGKTSEVFTKENVEKTYGGRLTILQKTEQIVA